MLWDDDELDRKPLPMMEVMVGVTVLYIVTGDPHGYESNVPTGVDDVEDKSVRTANARRVLFLENIMGKRKKEISSNGGPVFVGRV